MPNYEALKNKQAELIRKALDGSVFLAPVGADPIANLTAVTGIAPDEVIDLVELPTDWDDLGWLTEDGAQFSRDVSASEVSSWGSVSPTRTDVTSDSTALTVVCQETKLLTIGLATGADLRNITVDSATGELRIAKPVRPKSRHYRVLSLAVDENEAGEIYIARFLPRAKVSSYAEQAFGGGDEPVTWGVTLVGEEDSDLGYSEEWLFGGPGWNSIVEDMGFTRAA